MIYFEFFPQSFLIVKYNESHLQCYYNHILYIVVYVTQYYFMHLFRLEIDEYRFFFNVYGGTFICTHIYNKQNELF